MSADFWAGYISGAAGIIIGNPLDLIKVRLQAGTSQITASSPSSYTSQFPSAGSLVRGVTAPVLGYGALNALLFMTYNRTTLLLAGATSSPPSLWTTWLAGAVGGLATWVVSTPTELVKCRAQASSPTSSPTPSSTSFGIARHILRTEGIRGLYFGGVVTALRDSIGYGFYFWSYELGTRALASKTSIPGTGSASAEAARVLLCGGVAGVVTWASIFPLDVIKTRVQTQLLNMSESAPLLNSPAVDPGTSSAPIPSQRVGALEMARRTYKNEGMAVFFKGLTVCSVRAFVVNAAQWAVYEWIMKELEPRGRTVMKQVSDTLTESTD
jgi:solute carrier family 25 (mitochondrial carnitine/acylcarnitine transporter), member 20/29